MHMSHDRHDDAGVHAPRHPFVYVLAVFVVLGLFVTLVRLLIDRIEPANGPKTVITSASIFLYVTGDDARIIGVSCPMPARIVA